MMLALGLGLACGALAASPFAWLARRETMTVRLRPLVTSGRRDPVSTPRRRRPSVPRPRVLASVLLVLGAPRARRRRRRSEASIVRELPVVVDIIGVAVSAGCTPYLAIEQAARYGPPRIASVLGAALQACALGQSLDDAFRDLGASVEVLRPLAEALRTSARLGSPAAPALARLAAEVRSDSRRRAEARARTVPVRLCFPLVACVLPAFALLTVAPVVVGGLRG